MTAQHLRRAVEHVCRTEGRRTFAARPDGELLGVFVDFGDEDAFAELVARHGAMVLGVCRRALRNAADAEDAFQAVFLVLARRAASIRPREHVGSWLYGVARRTARKARALADKRRAREHAMPIRGTERARGPDPELCELLERELARLPDHYRLPIVLCDLEGLTRREAAARLGCPEGSVAGHLARGRALLARRLLRRGVAPALAAGTLWANHSAAVPPALGDAAVKLGCAVRSGLPLSGLATVQAQAMAHAVCGGLRLARWKIAVVILAGAAATGLGAGLGRHVEHPGVVQEQVILPPAKKPALPPAPKPDDVTKAKPADAAPDSAEAKPGPSEAEQRYEQARAILADVGAGKVAPGDKLARLAEARDLMAKNLVPEVRDREPRIHELSSFGAGHVAFAQQEYSDAESLLTSALKQYPSSEEAPPAKYTVGRCYWFQAGRESRRAFDGRLGQTERESAKEHMCGLLEKARQITEPLEEDLLNRPPGRELSDTDKQILRQTSFLVAECYFYGENYEEAARRYLILRARYAGQLAELIALGQLWQCYTVYLDKPEQGAAMLVTMRELLRRLPDDEFNNSSDLRTRKYWENWIKKAGGDGKLTETPATKEPPLAPPGLPPGFDPSAEPVAGPVVVRAWLRNDGRIGCKLPKKVSYQPVNATIWIPWIGRRPYTTYIEHAVQEERSYAPEMLTATRADGKRVSPDELRQRLAKETRALFVCGNPPDPEMLFLMKGSTLILTLRAP